MSDRTRQVRRSAGKPLVGPASGPGTPRARNYLYAALGFTVFAIYGSLVPLQYVYVSFDEAVRRFQLIPYLDLDIGSRSDWVANILLFIPISFFWMGAFLVDRKGWLRSALVSMFLWLGCALLSVLIEFTQIWFPARTVSLNDIIAETIGGTIGIALWLAVGNRLTEFLRSYLATRRPSRQLEWLLQAYFLGLLIYSFMPFDLTISPAELWHKYKEGKIILIPFTYPFESAWEMCYSLTTQALIFIPVGMLTAIQFVRRGGVARSLGRSVLLGFLLTTGVELGQLIVYTRFTNTTDIIVGTTGVWAGAWLMRRWRGAANSASISLAATRQAALPWRWAAIAAVYTLLLVAVSWAPFNFVRDRQLVETHLDNFFSVPFKVLYQGTEMNALRMVLRKTLWFAPLGCLLAMQVVSMSRIRLPRALLIWCSLFAALVVAGVVEMGKIFLPERNPDLTSMLISASGSAVGLFIMLRLVLSRDTQRGTVVPSLARETLSPRITEVR